MTTQTRNWPPAEAGSQTGEAASQVDHHVTGMATSYPITDWRTWSEVEITVNDLLPAGPCERCGWLDRPITCRVHFHDDYPQDVCDVCAPRVVQDAVTWNPDHLYLTQVETAS